MSGGTLRSASVHGYILPIVESAFSEATGDPESGVSKAQPYGRSGAGGGDREKDREKGKDLDVAEAAVAALKAIAGTLKCAGVARGPPPLCIAHDKPRRLGLGAPCRPKERC